MPDLQMTQRFEVSPYLIMVEGEAHALALLVGMVYADPRISHSDWSISHALKSRRELIAHLRTQGDKRVRVGVSAETEKVVEQIRRRAEALVLQFNVLRTRSGG
jgi:hypothetical protein